MATATPAMAAASAASASVRPLLHQLQPHRGQPAPASAARGSPESPRHRHRASSAVGDAVTTETIAIDVNGPCSYASAGTPPTAVTPHPSRRRPGAGAHVGAVPQRRHIGVGRRPLLPTEKMNRSGARSSPTKCKRAKSALSCEATAPLHLAFALLPANQLCCAPDFHRRRASGESAKISTV